MAVIPTLLRRYGGRLVVALVAFAALVLSTGLPDCAGHDHDHDHGGEHGELPGNCQCTCTAAMAVVPDTAEVVAPLAPVIVTVTEYIASPLPDVVVGVDPPPDKCA